MSVLLKLGWCKNEYTPLKISGAKLNFRLQMSNLTRIQPQVSLIIHYTGVQQTVVYKRVLLKENPFPFHGVSNGTTWKRNVTTTTKKHFSFGRIWGFHKIKLLKLLAIPMLQIVIKHPKWTLFICFLRGENLFSDHFWMTSVCYLLQSTASQHFENVYWILHDMISNQWN